ncbi:MAG: aldehyde dehydrogenase [Mucilaginibacter sp.]|nr:aldehyde dehydrogenase [Mucilaginibacter sp.]
MATIEKSIEILNDLIEINNDRVAGFTHAAKELNDKDLGLRAIFMQLRDDSRKNVHELGTTINKNGGEVEMGMSGSGALHRMWLDVKATFSGHDRKSVLAECERGEDAIKKAYQTALSAGSGLSPEFSEIVLRQQMGIIAAHNQIKALRDSQA